MKSIVYIFFIICYSFHSFSQEKVLFFQTDWGFDGSIEEFIKKAKDSGYDGIETWAPTENDKKQKLKSLLKEFDLQVIFLCGTNPNDPFQSSILNYENYLNEALEQKPLAINSHTGSDFYTFEQNLAFIEFANKLSEIHNIPIYHETHRARFSYSLPETIKYLQKNKDWKLTLDISHWMVVHESTLTNRKNLIEHILSRSHHIHARVGFEESPQVNDPKAPEWKGVVDRHLDLWEAIIRTNLENGKTVTITTEFGPPNYMPTEPYTQNPMSDQWESNTYMMKLIKDRINNSGFYDE